MSNDEAWMEDVRRWYYGGTAPEAYRDESLAEGQAPDAGADDQYAQRCPGHGGPPWCHDTWSGGASARGSSLITRSCQAISASSRMRWCSKLSGSAPRRWGLAWA